MARVAIVGGGFRGIAAAYFLQRDGHAVTLIEAASVLGGVLHGLEWNGFYLDKGCHLFSNRDLSLTRAMLDIMDGQVLPVEFRYASVTAGTLTEGIAIPDLSVLGDEVSGRILHEVITAASQTHDEPETLADCLVQRFGPSAAGYLEGAVVKALACRPEQADTSALRTANLGRIKLLPETPSALLKQLPELDERLACSSQGNPFRFVDGADPSMPARHYYPAGKGMTGFCEAAREHLATSGVDLRLGLRIETLSVGGGTVQCRLSDGRDETFDRLVWTLDAGLLAEALFAENPLRQLHHKVPLILYYFVVPEAKVGSYTYLHDFTPEHLAFRISIPGRYGGQVKPDGSTFICCEVTTQLDSPVWRDPEGHAEAVWHQVEALGAVARCAPSDLHVLKTPVSFPVGKPGLAKATKALASRIAEVGPEILVDTGGAFYKNDILRDIRLLTAA